MIVSFDDILTTLLFKGNNFRSNFNSFLRHLILKFFYLVNG